MWREDEKFREKTKERGRREPPYGEGPSLQELLDRLATHAPTGFSAGLHIRFASPLVYVREYPQSWLDVYDQRAYALRDPIVFWGIAMKGSTRWSEIRLPDPFEIFKQARSHGLAYGVVFSTGPIQSRSIVGIARSDREFTDDEIAEVAPLVTALHAAAEPPCALTRAQIEALELLANGHRHAAAADMLGISESALKARLQSARLRLKARTTAEALKKAREYQLL